MTSNRALLTALSVGILMGPVALADLVELNNGDRVTGKIVKKDKDSVTIKSEFMGEVTIKWQAVKSVTSDEPLNVVTADGKTITGKLATSAGNVQVTTASGPQELSLAGVQEIRNSDQQAKYERMLKPGVTQLWAGYLDFGAALARGNAETTTLTTAFKATRATRHDKATAYFNEIFSTATIGGKSVTSAKAVRGGWSYDRNLKPRLFVNVFNDYEYDAFQNLDLRFVAGGGAGYAALKTDRLRLDLLGGVAYNRENYSVAILPAAPGVSPQLTRDSAEAYWGDDLSYKLSGLVSFNQGFRMFNNLSNTGEYRVNFDTGLQAAIRKWVSWQITFSDRYLTNPPALKKKNDILLSTGIRMSFAR